MSTNHGPLAWAMCDYDQSALPYRSRTTLMDEAFTYMSVRPDDQT